MTVRVVLPLPVDKAFTYGVPEDVQGVAQTGSRVLVPFGSRRLTGVIVGTGGDPADLDFEVKDILEVLDDRPALTEELLQLCRWIAEYYVCGWGEAVKAALPTGTGVKSVLRLERTVNDRDGWTGSTAQEALLEDVEQFSPTTLSAARRRLKPQVSRDDVDALVEAGLLGAVSELSGAAVDVKTERHLRFTPAFRRTGAARDLKNQLRGAKQRAVVEVLAGFLAEGRISIPAGEVRKRADASRTTVRSLLQKGILEVVHRETRRSPLDDLPDPGEPPQHRLHDAQVSALADIRATITDEKYASYLLHGVTGSGKTEVYIAAVKEVVRRGRTAIILVPEIALTPQTVQRFRAHFEGKIAVLHSQMSMGERYDAWRGLRDGDFSIAIGPRSAVLAPLQNLGLIVVDEEHESSYKQFDPAPRYHARDLAVMRAHRAGAVCILGSATPSLESALNAETGKYKLLRMPDRIPVPAHDAAPFPEVAVVDLRKQQMMGQLEGTLSKPLREAIEARLERGEQTILLHNRRGFASVLECEECGHTPECSNCSVTLTYHKARRQLRCHYCGFARPLPAACPACNEPALEQLGSGTQKVEEELEACFPAATVARMDRDTTSRKNAHHRILQQFGKGEADILLGTQMIAKGLDFSRVTLVGVVNTDVGLMMPDFRAEERTFQLLMQVAGRAGRASLRGEVLLQTRNPEHPVIRFAKEHDYGAFLKSAMEERRMLNYPPYGRLVAVEFKGPKESRVAQLARRWTNELRSRLPAAVEVLGPEPPVIARVKRYHRFQTLIRLSRGSTGWAVQDIIRSTEEACGNPPRGYHIAVDVDAVGLM